ncbi:MAG: hypothetical protein ACO3JL_00755 [Myxococcota bacterium]
MFHRTPPQKSVLRGGYLEARREFLTAGMECRRIREWFGSSDVCPAVVVIAHIVIDLHADSA